MILAFLRGRASWVTRSIPPVVFGPPAVYFAIAAFQQMALRHYRPDGFLPYGFFLSNIGSTARYWVVELPFAGALLACVLLAAAMSVAGIRDRKPWLVLGTWLWCAILFASYAMYCGYLLLQGDATVFV